MQLEYFEVEGGRLWEPPILGPVGTQSEQARRGSYAMLTMANSLSSSSKSVTAEGRGDIAMRARLTVERDFAFEDVLDVNGPGVIWTDEVACREAERVVTGMSRMYD